MKDIPDRSVDMILADPPYGTTACKWDSVIPLEPMWEHLKRVIRPNGAIVMTASQPFTTTLIASNMKMFKYCWVWEKTRPSGFVHSKRQPLKSHEDICVFGLGGITHGSKIPMTYCPQMTKGEPYSRGNLKAGPQRHLQSGNKLPRYHDNKTGDRFPRTVVKISNPNNKSVHPTQKPIKLMEYLIKTYTNEGETVLDFAMGSGTTGVACANLGRDFIGIELDEKYFKIAEDRIRNHSVQLGFSFKWGGDD